MKNKIFAPIVLLGILASCLSGCGLLFVLPATSPPINTNWEPSQSHCDYERPKSDKVVVLVSASGGGKRAAAFAFGALRGLSKIELPKKSSTLLKEVDFVSRVSGGAVPIAYYALNHNSEKDFQGFMKFLKEDTTWELIKKAAWPFNWFQSNTHILANHFGETLFQNKTFKDLFAFGRPEVILTAADLSRGQRFYFDSKQFVNLHSDLCSFPVKYAVAASAAYPTYFHTLSLKNFTEEKEPKYANQKHAYIPLTDGGVLDNFGTRRYLDLLDDKGKLIGDAPESEKSDPRPTAKGVIFIMINAGLPLEPRFHEKAESPGLISRLSRSYEVTYERQIADSQDLFLESLLKRTKEWNIGYCNIQIDLKYAGFTDAQLKEFPTAWTLPDEQIDQLVEGAEAMLYTDENIPRIKNVVEWLEGGKIGKSCG